MAANVLLKATGVASGGTSEDYFFKGNGAVYTADVATATGIAVAAEADQGKVAYRVPDLLLSGVLIRLVASVGTSTNPKSVRLLCTIEKLATVRAALKGKALAGGTVKSVRVPRDAVVI